MNEERNDCSNDDDNEDIYNDIGDFHFDRELTKLEESNKGYVEDIINLTEKLKQLMEQNSELQTKNDILVTNISTLLKTSKAEIERKQLVIDQLRKIIDNMNVKNKYNNKEDIIIKEFCESCAKLQTNQHMKNKQIDSNVSYEQIKNNQNSSNIEEGEIVSDNCEQANIALVSQKNEDSDNAGKGNLGNHRKKKKSRERSRQRSTEKHLSEYKRSNHPRDSYSHQRRSSRSRKRHRSRDRRHSERMRSKEKSREKSYSSRSKHHCSRSSHRSRYSSEKSRNKSSEKVESSNIRHSSPYERSSRSKCEGELKDRKDKRLEENFSKVRKLKETEVKTSVTDSNLNKKSVDHKEEKIDSVEKEITIKEKNINLKKLNVDEYNPRRPNLSRDQGNGDIQRHSVLDGLYDNSVNVNMSVINKVQVMNREDKALTQNEFGIDSDSLNEGWYQNTGKKLKTPKKPKTLYSKRMEAKILQQLNEEATSKLSDEVKEEKSKCNEKQVAQKEFDQETKRIDTKEIVQENSVFEDAPSDVTEKKGEISVEEFIDVKFDEANDEGGKVTKSLSFQNTIVRLNADKISTEVKLLNDHEKNNEVSGKKNDSSWKVSEFSQKAPEPLPLIKSVKTPEQTFGESLIKKLLQLQRSQESGIFKEFSPLKNNYKLLEISPLKTAPRQHILEYYNLKFCTHQLSNIEPEGFDLSLTLPITPGKNLYEFGGLTDPQESIKAESDDASDKLKILDDDKISVESYKTDDNNVTDEKFRNETADEQLQVTAVNKYGKCDKDDKKTKNNNKKIKTDFCAGKKNSEICHDENYSQNKKKTEMKMLETNSGHRSYYMRTRRSNKIDNEKCDKKDSEWDVKRGSISVCGKKASHGKLDSHKRKRSVESSNDEDSMDDFIETKKKKPVKRNGNQSAGQKNKKDEVERLEDFTKSEFAQEEAKKLDEEKLTQNFKMTSPVGSADADISDNTKNVLEDLSLSNSSDGRITASNSMTSFAGDMLCLESSANSAEKMAKTDDRPEGEAERTEYCDNSVNFASYKLRKYFTVFENEESEQEDLTESNSGSSGEYSDSGASAFVDLL